MNRRYFLKGLGAGTTALSFTPSASSASSTASAKSCKVIGIGSAGCNFVQFAWLSNTTLKSDEWEIDFICVDSDPHVLNDIAVGNAAAPERAPIKALALETFASTSGANTGRVAAFRQRDAISALLANTDVIFLVAGLGGKAGSGAIPIMAKLARQAGAMPIAAVITPFEFEGEARLQVAHDAIRHLKREASLVVEFHNDQLMVVGSDLLTQDDAFAFQNHSIELCIRSLMDFVSQG